MIPESIPGQFADDSVILMQIMATVCKDDVRRIVTLQLLEIVLDVVTDVGKVTVPELFHDHTLAGGASQEQIGAPYCFPSPPSGSTEDNPAEISFRIFRRQS